MMSDRGWELDDRSDASGPAADGPDPDGDDAARERLRELLYGDISGPDEHERAAMYAHTFDPGAPNPGSDLLPAPDVFSGAWYDDSSSATAFSPADPDLPAEPHPVDDPHQSTSDGWDGRPEWHGGVAPHHELSTDHDWHTGTDWHTDHGDWSGGDLS